MLSGRFFSEGSTLFIGSGHLFEVSGPKTTQFPLALTNPSTISRESVLRANAPMIPSFPMATMRRKTGRKKAQFLLPLQPLLLIPPTGKGGLRVQVRTPDVRSHPRDLERNNPALRTQMQPQNLMRTVNSSLPETTLRFGYYSRLSVVPLTSWNNLRRPSRKSSKNSSRPVKRSTMEC